MVQFPTEKELLKFVLHSNLIEEEPANPVHPLFQSHLEACKLVIDAIQAGWSVPHPRQIHEILMAPEPHKLPGQYRPPHDPGAFQPHVGKEPLIAAHLISGRMTDWEDRVRSGPESVDVETWMWQTHIHFEHIHPFMDGNGRTGRIHMNGLRLVHGLPWLVVRFEDRDSYFARFR